MPIIITPGAGVDEELEQLELGGLALNDDTFTLEALSAPVPEALAEWIRGADSNGALLARPPLHANRVIEARIRVAPQASHDAVVAHIGSVLDQLQECGHNTNGLDLVWDPAGSTVDPITFRCLLGEIIDLPIDWQDSGRFVNSWMFTIRLTCLPFGEGQEYLVATTTSSVPIITLTLEDVPGDVPGLARLVVTDAATQSRRYVAWGMESRWLGAAPSLIVDSSAMTANAGATATRTGAYSGASNNVISATLRTQVQAICTLPNLTHVGLFRPQLRLYASATTMAVRLTWQALEGPFRSLSYMVPAVVGWNHVDLGSINIPEAALGTQRWTGRIEAYSTATGEETFAVDAIWLMPAERYGKARASYAYSAGVLTALDDFTGTTAAAALNARVLPVGSGSWATSGGTTDFAFSDGPESGDETLSRSDSTFANPARVATMGSGAFTNVEFGFDVRYTEQINSAASSAAFVRYVDASNYAIAEMHPGTGGASNPMEIRFAAVVASSIVLDTGSVVVPTPMQADTWYRLRVIIFASGQGRLSWFARSGGLLGEVPFAHPALATGGALASGVNRLRDSNGSGNACTRYYDNIYAIVPPAEPIACYSGQSIEFTSDATLREDSTGTYSGPPPEYIGGRFTVPNAGGPNRDTRVGVIARRNDIEVAADNDLVSNATMDSTTVAVYVRPQYLALPR